VNINKNMMRQMQQMQKDLAKAQEAWTDIRRYYL